MVEALTAAPTDIVSNSVVAHAPSLNSLNILRTTVGAVHSIKAALGLICIMGN